MKMIKYIALVHGTFSRYHDQQLRRSQKRPGKIYMPDMAYSRAYETMHREIP